jgi:hypothetical protein
MIRERVSTQGVIRPLEPENELDAFHVPAEIIGVFSELAIRRYLDGRVKFDAKFAGVIKTIEKDRRRNLERARKDTLRTATLLRDLPRDAVNLVRETRRKRGRGQGPPAGSDSWGYAWAIDADEMPPPSSIVSRRDTQEARRLAKIADQSVIPADTVFGANDLWTVMNNFLTVSPDHDKGECVQEKLGEEAKQGKRKSRLSQFITRTR